MIKNNKGFALTEILILSAVVIGVLTFMYIQFKNINRSYQYSFKYDTVEGMFLANNIVNYINNDNYDILVEKLNTNQEGYLDITNCDLELFQTPLFCEQLIQKSEIKQIIFTNENTSKLKANMQKLDNDFQEYIKKIKTINTENDYRIIIKYNDGTFTTMRFNKGNAYVQNGLIAYLDGINNTGNGHSNETQTWKDLSNHGNDATLYNNPTWSNNSLTFDGIDDYGVLTNTANQEFPNGLTVETRVKVLSITDFGGYAYNLFIDNVSSTNPVNGLSIYIHKDNMNIDSRLALLENPNSYTTPNALELYELNNFYTIVIKYDNNNAKIYINGELKNTKEIQGTYAQSQSAINLAKRVINAHYANVEFQNILIYDRALTDNEVLRNYQADMARY